MTQEDKELLLKDLCARLTHGIKVQYTMGDGTHIDCGVDMVSIASECVGIFELGTSKVVWRGIEHIKPYLRPLSSMTEEEYREWQSYKCSIVESCDRRLEEKISALHDWFNSHYLDWRGLIPKGLALEAKEGMYKSS